MEKKKSQMDSVFTISIKSTQNHTWQGTLFWTQTKQNVSFRSALELIRLLASAIEKEEICEEDCEENCAEDL